MLPARLRGGTLYCPKSSLTRNLLTLPASPTKPPTPPLTHPAGVAGYMIGPPLGAAAWRVYNRRFARSLEAMDARFYEHVRRNRADPAKQTLSSSAHPLPDYYGEKVRGSSLLLPPPLLLFSPLLLAPSLLRLLPFCRQTERALTAARSCGRQIDSLSAYRKWLRAQHKYRRTSV